MMGLTDARGQQLQVGDFVIEERGLVYQIHLTEPSFLRQRLARVMPCRLQRGYWVAGTDHTYVRLNQVFRIRSNLLGTQEQHRQLWHDWYVAFIRPHKRTEIAARRVSIEKFSPRSLP